MAFKAVFVCHVKYQRCVATVPTIFAFPLQVQLMVSFKMLSVCVIIHYRMMLRM